MCFERNVYIMLIECEIDCKSGVCAGFGIRETFLVSAGHGRQIWVVTIFVKL